MARPVGKRPNGEIVSVGWPGNASGSTTYVGAGRKGGGVWSLLQEL